MIVTSFQLYATVSLPKKKKKPKDRDLVTVHTTKKHVQILFVDPVDQILKEKPSAKAFLYTTINFSVVI